MGEVSASHRSEVKGQEEGSSRTGSYLAAHSMTPATHHVLLMFPLKNVRKIVLYYNTILARGPAGRVPVASPRAVGAPGAQCPRSTSVTRIALTGGSVSRAGRVVSPSIRHQPCTNDWPFDRHVGGAFLLPPSPHDQGAQRPSGTSSLTNPPPIG